MTYLTLNDLLFVYAAVLEESGGSDGVREKGALESAVGQPAQVVFGRELYPTVFLKAAVYARSIIAHHPFVDGNKRTATVAALTFLELNGQVSTASDDEVFNFAQWVATEKPEDVAIAGWFEKYSNPVG